MPNTIISITGLTELANLEKNKPDAFKQIWNSVTTKYANIMLQEMRTRVPVKTGYLRSTIGSSSSATVLQLYVTAHYAGFINYGTSRMAGRPFFTGVIDQFEPQMIQEMNDEVGKWLNSNVKRS